MSRRAALLASLAAAASAQDLSVPAGVARAATPHDPSRPVLNPIPGVDLAAMWAAAAAADAPTNSSVCRAQLLQYEFSLRLLPERAPLRDVFDALQLGAQCGVPAPPAPASTAFFEPLDAAALAAACGAAPTFYVAPAGGSDAGPGSRAAPFATIARALAATRAARAPGAGAACVVLRGGVHFLGATQLLTAADSGLVVTGAAGDAPAWVSGGAPLGALAWAPYDVAGAANVWVADVPAGVPVTAMPGLNTLDASGRVPPSRFFRAHYPDYDIEFFSGSLPGDRDVNWVKPPVMAIPELFYKDLNAAGLKNDSTMREYNIYATGRGGPCAHWANDGDEWAYVCSNNTAGGWEFIERNLASSGQLGFPVAMVYNDTVFPNFDKWTMPAADPHDWSNTPTISVWHNQGWFVGTYAITGIDTANHVLNMSADGVWPAGGWQGGRTMENRNPQNTSVASPMGSGPWYVSNVFEELTAPGEYFFDPAARKLYVFYNASAGTPPPPGFALAVPQLEVFFNLSGSPAAPVADVLFAGIGLRDQRAAQLDRWHDPSGGDWGIRRAGLFHLEGTERVTVQGSTFFRTDANAVFLAAYNRNATVARNEFAFTGMSCVVTFGRSVQDDATGGLQPWGTVLAYNKAHEIGAFQLQSSFWFNSKATLTRSEGNVVFNIPRAAINLNDGLGGGNNITLQSIFNTCRQSGDHGPINSWDRMPFLTRIASLGGAASYDSKMTETTHSMIIANYGASQGFDNDDGSSWYDTHDNFFYDANGFKMDYGGHDSHFHSNVIVGLHGQGCIGTAGFVPGHVDTYHDNDCIVFRTETVDALFENCNPSLIAAGGSLKGYNNRYYTPLGNASANCDCCGVRPLAQLSGTGLADNFTASVLPAPERIIAMGRAKLLI